MRRFTDTDPRDMSLSLRRRASLAPHSSIDSLDFVASGLGKRRKTIASLNNVQSLVVDLMDQMSPTIAEQLTSSADSGLDSEYRPVDINPISDEKRKTLEFTHLVAASLVTPDSVAPLVNYDSQESDLPHFFHANEAEKYMEFPPPIRFSLMAEVNAALDLEKQKLVDGPSVALSASSPEKQQYVSPIQGDEQTIEFTRPLRPEYKQRLHVAPTEDEQTMEFTRPLRPEYKQQLRVAPTEDEQTMELTGYTQPTPKQTTSVHSFEDEQAMELTQPLVTNSWSIPVVDRDQTSEKPISPRDGVDKPRLSPSKSQEQVLIPPQMIQDSADADQEQTMELTRPMRTNVRENTVNHVADENLIAKGLLLSGDGKEFTDLVSPRNQEQAQTPSQILQDSADADQEQTMELTRPMRTKPAATHAVDKDRMVGVMASMEDRNQKTDLTPHSDQEQAQTPLQMIQASADADQEQTMELTRPMRTNVRGNTVNHVVNQNLIAKELLLSGNGKENTDLVSRKNQEQVQIPLQMIHESADADQEQTMELTRPMRAKALDTHAADKDQTVGETVLMEDRNQKTGLAPSGNQEQVLIIPQPTQDNKEAGQAQPVDIAVQSSSSSAQQNSSKVQGSRIHPENSPPDKDQSTGPALESERHAETHSPKGVVQVITPIAPLENSSIIPDNENESHFPEEKAEATSPQHSPASPRLQVTSPQIVVSTSQPPSVSPELSRSRSDVHATEILHPSGHHLETIDEHSIDDGKTQPISPVQSPMRRSRKSQSALDFSRSGLGPTEKEGEPLAEYGSQPMELTQEGMAGVEMPIISPTLHALNIDAVPAIDEISIGKPISSEGVELQAEVVGTTGQDTTGGANQEDISREGVVLHVEVVGATNRDTTGGANQDDTSREGVELQVEVAGTTGQDTPRRANQDGGSTHDEKDPLGDDELQFTQIPFEQFLRDTGVSFTTDMDNASHSDPPKPAFEEDLAIDQYFRAFPKLELVTLHDFCAGEMRKNIAQAGQVFSDFEATIAHTTPPFLRQYYLASDQQREVLNSKVQMVRELANVQLRILWHQWRSQLWRSLVVQLQLRRENLVVSQHQIEKDLERLALLHARTKEACQSLQPKLEEMRRLKKSTDALDAVEAAALKDEITVLYSKLKTTKEQVLQMEEKVDRGQRQLVHAKQERDIAVQQLEKQRQALQSRPTISTTELKALKYKYAILKGVSGLEPDTMNEKTISFIYRKSIKVDVDFRRKVFRITGHVAGSDEFLCGDFLKTVFPGITRMIDESASIKESFAKLERLWPLLKLVDSNIYKAKLGYPVRFHIASEHLIECTIAYIDNTGHKTDLAYTVDLAELSLYPRSAVLKVPHQSRSTIECMKQEKFLHHLFSSSTVSEIPQGDHAQEVA